MKPLTQKLDEKYTKADGCWVWHGATQGSKGSRYGIIDLYIDGKYKRSLAHRLMFERFNGPIPEGLCVRHSCDNPQCVNPEHLLLGTHADNMKDKVRRNRQHRPLGEKNGRSKLTPSDVDYIRKHYIPRGNGASGNRKELAEKFGVDGASIRNAAIGATW